MRLENNNPNIKIILIEPGPVTSKIRENSVRHFEKWITVEGSHYQNLYNKVLIPRLHADSGGRDPFQLEPEAVSAKIERALTLKNPASRYYVTTATYMLDIARRILPTFLMDKIARRI